MNEIIILSSLGFIFGWITSRVNYKRKLINFIYNIHFEANSPNQVFKDGMVVGIDTTKNYIIEVVVEGKIGKKHSKEFSGKDNN